MKYKSLMNLLPIAVILTIAGAMLLHHWQAQKVGVWAGRY